MAWFFFFLFFKKKNKTKILFILTCPCIIFLQCVEFLNVMPIVQCLTVFVWIILVFSFHLREILNVFIPGQIWLISFWSCLSKGTVIYQLDPVALEYFLNVYLQPGKKNLNETFFFFFFVVKVSHCLLLLFTLSQT